MKWESKRGESISLAFQEKGKNLTICEACTEVLKTKEIDVSIREKAIL